jgi:hypothetical protein
MVKVPVHPLMQLITDLQIWANGEFMAIHRRVDKESLDPFELVTSFSPWIESALALGAGFRCLSQSGARQLRREINQVLDSIQRTYDLRGRQFSEAIGHLQGVEDLLVAASFAERTGV